MHLVFTNQLMVMMDFIKGLKRSNIRPLPWFFNDSRIFFVLSKEKDAPPNVFFISNINGMKSNTAPSVSFFG